jgi:DsbC/DsbD-like thiol-disulfide interchange protein
MKHFSLILSFLFLPLLAFGQENHLKVELLSETPALAPGKPATLGLHFTMDNGWHIYWQNPGDAGLAPTVNWKLPIGFKAGKILWPLPKRISLPSVMDFGYENEITLLVPIQVPRTVKPGETFNLTANVQWLVCKETCIPGQATLHLPLTIGPAQGPSNALITAARAQLPEKQPKDWNLSGTLDNKQFVLSFLTETAPKEAFFFPLQPGQIDNNAEQILQPTDKGFSMTLKRSDLLTQNVQKLEGLLVISDHDVKKGYEVTIPLTLNQ